MLKAIIFDMDGVLIDSEALMRFAFSESYQLVVGQGKPPIEAYLEHMGKAFPDIMDHLGLPHTLWEPYREICQTHLDQISLFPECRNLLEWARSRHLKLAILTGKDRERTLQLLDYFDLQRYFDAVIASDQIRHPKPHPEGMLLLLKLLDCTSEETVMIGDAVSDIECAQQAGVTAIAVTWGIKSERVQTLCLPDYVVHDWKSLSELLSNLHQDGFADRQARPYHGDRACIDEC